jgi:hypothetical protein
MEKANTILPQPGNRVYRDQLVTLADLQEFKEDLLLSMKTIIQNNSLQQGKRWLKSYEVKKLLNISTGTLQNLRANGSLPFSKVGGLIYYDADEINRILDGKKPDSSTGHQPISKKINLRKK